MLNLSLKKYTKIDASEIVIKNFPAYSNTTGNPAKLIKSRIINY